MEQRRPFVAHVPAILVSAGYLLGGYVRLSPWPFYATHELVRQKAAMVAPILYPLIPFKDATGHDRWMGTWLLGTGALVATPATRGSNATLGLVLFWSSTIAYGEWKTGTTPWFPLFNIVFGLTNWWIENRTRRSIEKKE